MSIPFCEFFLIYFLVVFDMKNWSDLTPVEKVLELCKRRSVAPSKVEKDLGFGNGYLNPKKVDDIKFKRLEIILNYLGVDWIEFFTGEEKPATDGDGQNDDEKHKLVNSLFDQLPFEDQVEAINKLRSLAQRQEAQDNLQESD